jgi:Flp pilus assembly pilin Flp
MLLHVSTWLQLKLDRRALTSIELALIGGVLVATIIVGFNVLTTSVSTKFSSVGTRL